MGSPWRDKISLAILELQEKGEIQMLYDKWWKSPKETCKADKERQLSKASALGVNNIGGIFVVLLCGLAFAVLIAIVEFYHNSRHQRKQMTYIDKVCMANASAEYLESESTIDTELQHGRDDKNACHQRQSIFSDMTDELCLAIRCQGSRQRTAFKRHCSKCQYLQKQFNEKRLLQQHLQQRQKQQQQHICMARHELEETSPPLPSPPSPPAVSLVRPLDLSEDFEMREFMTTLKTSV